MSLSCLNTLNSSPLSSGQTSISVFYLQNSLQSSLKILLQSLSPMFLSLIYSPPQTLDRMRSLEYTPCFPMCLCATVLPFQMPSIPSPIPKSVFPPILLGLVHNLFILWSLPWLSQLEGTNSFTFSSKFMVFIIFSQHFASYSVLVFT